MNNHLEELKQEKLFKLNYLKALFYVALFIIGMLPAAIIQYIATSILGSDGEIGRAILIFSNIIPFLWIIFMAYFWSRNEKESFQFNFNLTWNLLPFIILLMLSVMMLSSYTTTFIPHDSGWLKELYDIFESLFKELMNSKWALIVSTCVFAPFFEEILFRGILLKGLINTSKNEKQVWLAILFTSFMFGLIHMNPWQFIAAMISGIALGYVYYRTKSLGNVIFMHALNNGVSVYILLKYEEMEPAELQYPEAYNLLFLLGYLFFMYLIYFFTRKNAKRSIT